MVSFFILKEQDITCLRVQKEMKTFLKEQTSRDQSYDSSLSSLVVFFWENHLRHTCPGICRQSEEGSREIKVR